MESAMAEGYVIVRKTDIKTGEVIFEKTFKNKLTNFSRSAAAALWAGLSVPIPTLISVGTGSGTPTANDTALFAEISGTRKNIDYATVWLTFYTQYSVTYQTNEALGVYNASTNPNSSTPITEVGLFDVNGNMWSHVMLTGVNHDNQSQLTIQWQIQQLGN